MYKYQSDVCKRLYRLLMQGIIYLPSKRRKKIYFVLISVKKSFLLSFCVYCALIFCLSTYVSELWFETARRLCDHHCCHSSLMLLMTWIKPSPTSRLVASATSKEPSPAVLPVSTMFTWCYFQSWPPCSIILVEMVFGSDLLGKCIFFLSYLERF